MAELSFDTQDQMERALGSNEGRPVPADFPNFASGGVTILLGHVETSNEVRAIRGQAAMPSYASVRYAIDAWDPGYFAGARSTPPWPVRWMAAARGAYPPLKAAVSGGTMKAIGGHLTAAPSARLPATRTDHAYGYIHRGSRA